MRQTENGRSGVRPLLDAQYLKELTELTEMKKEGWFAFLVY